MDVFTLLTAIVILVVSVGLVLSLWIRSQQKKEIDHGVSSKIKSNPVWLNPIILSYVLFAAVIFALVWVFKLYYKVPF